MWVRLRGLDNSGKTTIVLKINGEDTSVISPTLGFNIKTIKYHKYAFLLSSSSPLQLLSICISDIRLLALESSVMLGLSPKRNSLLLN
jgi:hypothetical protein